MLQEVFDLFRAHDTVSFIILALVCAGWVVILERFVLLQLVYRVNFTKFNSQLKKMLSAGDVDRARLYCTSTSKVGVPLIVRHAIDAFETDTFKVRMVVSEEILAFMPRLRRRLSQLPNLAACAVLLGALAAVHGVWLSFNSTDLLELGVKGFAFSRGLSTAVVPLALALAASVLLLLPYGILDAIAGRLESEIEHSLTVALNILSPEMQAAFAPPPPSVGAAVANLGGPSSDAGGGGDGKGAGLNGLIDEVSNDRAEQVPDEEEII